MYVLVFALPLSVTPSNKSGNPTWVKIANIIQKLLHAKGNKMSWHDALERVAYFKGMSVWQMLGWRF